MESQKKRKKWSTAGCVLKEKGQFHAVCECNHMSMFIILSNFHQYVGKDLGLEIFSISAFVIAVIVPLYSLYNTKGIDYSRKYTISCLLVGHFMILTLVDRNYFDLNEGMCTAVGFTVHYVLLCGLLWAVIHLIQKALVEEEKLGSKEHIADPLEEDISEQGQPPSGSSHHTMQNSSPSKDTENRKKLFFSKEIKQGLIYHAIGFGIPITITLLTLILAKVQGPTVRAYGGDFCWLDGRFIWALYGPFFAMLFANFAISGILLLWRAKKYETRSVNFRSFLKENMAISLFICATWVIAFHQLGPTYKTSSFLSYAFPIALNLQTIALGQLDRGLFKKLMQFVPKENLLNFITKKLAGRNSKDRTSIANDTSEDGKQHQAAQDQHSSPVTEQSPAHTNVYVQMHACNHEVPGAHGIYMSSHTQQPILRFESIGETDT